ncbi:hypothetical protein [Finegoldia sp. BIOML-A1]|uniref:hypothetical protein n=1 Tax=Finegoldia sp. BIOML-A1 TaxID=2584649 RepID=UPI0012AEEF02|nr:hypothetical protein [Finegoldia sp. BIOML-A1]MSB11704.1 hypothetical protein [Finegoldia sp. BIOML-A1]
MKPNWTPKLKDVLGYPTKEITKVSKRTGQEYNVEVIETITLVSIGSKEETLDNNYRYFVADPKKELEYAVKVPNEVEVSFGTRLIFRNLRGGLLPNSNNGWYSADSVEVVAKNA